MPGAAAVPCLAGTYGPDDGPCAPCPAGSYCLGGTDAVRCPERSSSSPNATELAGCFCLAGSSGDDGGPCVACPFGTYKVVNGTETCTACPEHTSTTGGAKAIEHCLCAKGYTGVGGNEPCEACTPGEPAALVQREVQCCPTVPTVFCWLISAIPPPPAAGKYKSALGQQACTACPGAGLTSAPAATAAGECICAVGYEGAAAGGPCTLCKAGFHKPAAGAGACTACGEEVLPSDASFSSPTSPARPCGWRCAAGRTLLPPSAFRPNACVPCAPTPAANPCAVGEWFSTSCASDADRGCRACTNLVGEGAYAAHHQSWTSPTCPFVCARGWKRGGTDAAPACVRCGASEFCGVEDTQCALPGVL